MARNRFLGNTRSRRRRNAAWLIGVAVVALAVAAFFFLPKVLGKLPPLFVKPTPQPVVSPTPEPSPTPLPEPDFVSAPVVSVAGESHPYYKMQVTIGDNLKDVQVAQQIEYQNNAGKPLEEIVLRCFVNSLTDLAAFPIDDKDAFENAGAPIELYKALVNDKRAVYTFDGKYKTTMRIALPEPLEANQSVSISLAYGFTLPSAKYRLGSSGGAQLSFFYPVPAQYGEEGWSITNINRSGSPWYQSTANYDVVIDAPKDCYVAATGTTASTKNTGDRQQLYIRAANARDFAIGASKGKKLSTSKSQTASVSVYASSIEKGKAAAQIAKDVLESYSTLFSSIAGNITGEIEIMQCQLAAKSATQAGLIFLDNGVVQGNQEVLEYEIALSIARLYAGLEVGGANGLNELISSYMAACYFGEKSADELASVLEKHPGAKALNQLKVDVGAIEFDGALKNYLQKGKLKEGNPDDFTGQFTDQAKAKAAIAPYV